MFWCEARQASSLRSTSMLWLRHYCGPKRAGEPLHSASGHVFAGKISAVNFSAISNVIRANDLRQIIDGHVLFVNRKLQIADNVDEQDVCDIQLDLNLTRYVPIATWNRAQAILHPIFAVRVESKHAL